MAQLVRVSKISKKLDIYDNVPELYEVGCLGKIDDLQKSKDGRILINLTGITRFEVLEEVKNSKLYREFKVDYKKFSKDLNPSLEETNIDMLIQKSKKFFKKNGLLLNWKEFERIEFSKSQRGPDGRYFIACRKENEDIYSQLSKGKLQGIDETTLEMILSEDDASFVEECEEHFLAKCKDNKEMWFPASEGLTDQYLESAFMSSLKGVKLIGLNI